MEPAAAPPSAPGAASPARPLWRRIRWARILIAVLVATWLVVVLLPDPKPEPTSYVLRWQSPGLFEHLDAARPLDTRITLSEADGVVVDAALDEAYGGHRLEVMAWSPPGGTATFEAHWDDPVILEAVIPVEERNGTVPMMTEFLVGLGIEGNGAAAVTDAWSIDGAPVTSGEVTCSDTEKDVDGHPLCSYPQAHAFRYRTGLAARQFDPQRFYVGHGGLAAAQVADRAEGYGALGVRLHWGDWAMGFSIETATVNGEADGHFHLLATRTGYVQVLLSQREPVAKSHAQDRAQSILRTLGFDGEAEALVAQ